MKKLTILAYIAIGLGSVPILMNWMYLIGIIANRNNVEERYMFGFGCILLGGAVVLLSEEVLFGMWLSTTQNNLFKLFVRV